jgi:hypothetical protein
LPAEPTEPGAKPTTVYYGFTWFHTAVVCAAVAAIAAIVWQTGDRLIAGLAAIPVALVVLLAVFPVIVRKPLLRLRDDSVTVYEAYTGHRVTAPWHEVDHLVYWRGTTRLFGVIPIRRGRFGIGRRFESSADLAASGGVSVVKRAKWKAPGHIPADVAANSVSTGVLAKRTVLAALAADPRVRILDARRAKHQHYIEGP